MSGFSNYDNTTVFFVNLTNSSLSFTESPLLGQCRWSFLNTSLTAVLLVTLLLNVFAGIVLFRVPLVNIRGRSNPVYLCIRSLNVTDNIQAFLLLVMPVFANSDCEWAGGDICCRIMGFIALFLLLVSPLITILMAFDRVVALYQPFKYRSHLGLKMLKILLPVACVLVLVTTFLPLVGIGDYHVVRGRRLCLLDTITDDPIDRSYVIAVHALFLVALLFMAGCTVAFQTKMALMKFEKKHKPLSKKRKVRNRTRSATMTTMAVCSIFIVCYFPYVARVLTEASSGKKSNTIVTWMTFALAFLQPMLNPVVCLLTNVRYRQELQVLLRRMKLSEVEMSTDSCTEGGSRSAFFELKNRLSFSGKGRKNSHQGAKRGREGVLSTTSAPASSREVAGVPDDASSLLLNSGKLTRNCNEDSKCSGEVNRDDDTQALALLERPHAALVIRRKPQASARSDDGHEHLAAPYSHQWASTFGRMGSKNEGTYVRERSHTVSGERSPVRTVGTAPRDVGWSRCSVTSAMLSSVSDNTSGDHVTVGSKLSVLLHHRDVDSQKNYERTSCLSDDVFIKCIDANNRSNGDTSNQSDVTHKQLEENCDVIKEMSKQKLISYVSKPSHRDSGMIDTSDPSS